jgi:hypothetical protein
MGLDEDAKSLGAGDVDGRRSVVVVDADIMMIDSV